MSDDDEVVMVILCPAIEPRAAPEPFTLVRCSECRVVCALGASTRNQVGERPHAFVCYRCARLHKDIPMEPMGDEMLDVVRRLHPGKDREYFYRLIEKDGYRFKR